MLTIIGSDAHAPYTDARAFASFIERIEQRKPQRVILNGDWWDFYQLSKFDKDPTRITSLQDDIDVGVDQVATVRRAMGPDAELIITEGNHEARLRRYLCAHPEISSLRALDARELFQLSRFSAAWVPYGKPVIVEGVHVFHGHMVRKFSGYTNQGYLAAYNASGTTGHTHRLGIVYKTVNGEVLKWAESGCLCQLDADYVMTPPDWQHGCCEIEDGELRVIAI